MTATHTVDHVHDQTMSEVAIAALLAEKGRLTTDTLLVDVYQHWLEPA